MEQQLLGLFRHHPPIYAAELFRRLAGRHRTHRRGLYFQRHRRDRLHQDHVQHGPLASRRLCPGL